MSTVQSLRFRKSWLWVLPLLAIFSAEVSPPANGQAVAWSRQRSGTLAWLHAVFFLDSQRGWVAGSKGTLLETSNGGESWVARSLPGGDSVREIYFADASKGWLVCERNMYEFKDKDDPRTYLLETNDGGQNWQRVNFWTEKARQKDNDKKKEKEVDVDLRLVRAIFTPSGKGWAFGEGGTIFGRSDPDADWTRLKTPTRYLLLGGTFIDDMRGWIVGAGATILVTSDGGESWYQSRLASVSRVRLTSVSFVDSRLGWTVGSGGAVFRTVNGGNSWEALHSEITADLSDVRFLNANEGWAAGANGTIIHTTDGGLHWTLEPTGTVHPIERLFFVDRTHGWAIGFGGTLLTYVSAAAPEMRK